MTGQAGCAGGTNGPCIVVAGKSAGGLELATRLGDKLGKRNAAQIILVDRNPTHTWKPLLHEVAAGSMDPNTHQLGYAARARWHGFEFQQGELEGLDRVAKSITVSGCANADGTEVLPERATSYDTLVLSIDGVTYFFGVPGTAEHAITLDTAWQAERFRRRLIAACMRAQNGVGDACPQVDIAIVGAGATGVELPAELRNTAHVLAVYGLHKLDPRYDIRIHLIEGDPCILPVLKERASAATTELLRELDMDVITSERVIGVIASVVNAASGKFIPADLTVWAAGIRAPPVLGELGLSVNKLGQVIVSRTLQVEGDDSIYVFGDCVSCL